MRRLSDACPACPKPTPLAAAAGPRRPAQLGPRGAGCAPSHAAPALRPCGSRWPGTLRPARGLRPPCNWVGGGRSSAAVMAPRAVTRWVHHTGCKGPCASLLCFADWVSCAQNSSAERGYMHAVHVRANMMRQCMCRMRLSHGMTKARSCCRPHLTHSRVFKYGPHPSPLAHHQAQKALQHVGAAWHKNHPL